MKDGTTVVLGRSYARADQLNLTGITDQVTAANNQTLGYSAANRLNSASGVYGAKSWVYDGVGNRTFCFALRMPTSIRAFFLALRMPTLHPRCNLVPGKSGHLVPHTGNRFGIVVRLSPNRPPQDQG